MCCEITLNNNSCVTAQITLTCPQQAGHRCNAASLWGALQRLSTLLFGPNNAYLNSRGKKDLQVFNLHCYPSSLVTLCPHDTERTDLWRRSEGMDEFPCKGEDEDYGKVSSFGLESYPVLCRNAISFKGKGKLDWQWKRQGGSSVACPGHDLTSWHLRVGMGVLVLDFAGQQPFGFGYATSSQATFLSWSYRCLAANNVSPAGH